MTAAAILQAEITERLAAAAGYERAGRRDQADRSALYALPTLLADVCGGGTASALPSALRAKRKAEAAWSQARRAASRNRQPRQLTASEAEVAVDVPARPDHSDRDQLLAVVPRRK